MFESIAGCLTPTSLFLLLNIVIGTIWVTSIFSTHHPKNHHHDPGTYYSPHPVAGAPSLMGRVGSINFGFHKYDPDHAADGYFPPAEQVYASITAQKTASSRLARAPSILDRVRSVNFNDFQFSLFHNPDPQQFHGHLSEPTPEIKESPSLARAPPSLLERVRSINLADLNLPHFSGFRSESPEISVADRCDGEDHRVRRSRSENESVPAADPKKPPPLALLERVRSITFADLNNFSVFSSEPPVAEPPEIEVSDPDLDRRRARRKEKMRKSASEKRWLRERSAAEEVERRRPETARVERTVSIGGDVEVDAKADDFINRFKQQLKLQRLDSILQYKEMINRGASK